MPTLLELLPKYWPTRHLCVGIIEHKGEDVGALLTYDDADSQLAEEHVEHQADSSK
jgi:hypothetical protein